MCYRLSIHHLLLPVLWLAGAAGAATLTVQTNVLGPTPAILGYNSGHFFPGSNTRDWWRYAGVNGARIFMSPGEIEFSDDLAPVGDGVTNRATFDARKAALRADPLDTNYINWAYFSNRYENNDLYPNNHIRPNAALTALRQLGVKPLIQITASQSRLPITDTNDWGGMWELWQHYYAQAFYLGRWFEVERYQMFNEPNHPNAGGLTQTNFFLRLQLASDAIQSALADVNGLFGKSLSARVFAPVTSGSAESSYTGGWGELVVTNRHRSFFNGWDTNFSLVHVYDYHQYGSTPASFGSSLATLHGLLTAAMTPAPRFPTSISEFNTRTGATFDTIPETLDSPTEYARFAAICVNLLSNGCAELYAFKFSQTESDAAYTYPVQKNAMHYVDNTNAPYHVGGITKAGEVYRLFNKAFAAGRTRLQVARDGPASTLEVHASADGPQRWLFIVNNNPADAALTINLAAWGIPTGGHVSIEEVSESCSGGVVLTTNLPASGTLTGTLPAYGVWLLTTARNLQTAQTLPASGDVELRDGTNRTANYGSATTMIARNTPSDPSQRTAAFFQFNLAGIPLTNLQFATLTVQAASATMNTTAQAHVYGITNAAWSEASITWAGTPSLRQNVPAGNTIARSVITGVGTNAGIVGQWVTTSATASAKALDVTGFVRGLAGTNATFLVVQDPRWDVTLPSLAGGDSQPDGVKLITTEGGSGPQLQLVFSVPNFPPVATNDAYLTAEDVALVVPPPGVLANDCDADPGDVLTAWLVSGPTNGTLSLGTNGGFTYTPATNFHGLDSFSYRANDGQADSAPATVSLTITPVNDPPVAAPDAAVTVMNQPVAIAVLTNDSDVDGDPLTIAGFTQGANGAVSDGGGGTLLYAPGLDFTGTDAFLYTVTDGQGGSNSALVTVTVLPPPGPLFWTNLLVTTEAFVRGGVNATSDQDEVAVGYLFAKHNAPSLDAARKVYLQFDFAGLNVNGATSATLTVTTHTNTFRQRVQLWGLNEAYPGFHPAITWNAAQANETGSNDLLTNGPFTGTRIGPAYLFSSAASAVHEFTIPNLSAFVRSNRATFVFTGVADATNDPGGLRLTRTNAWLQVQVIPPAPPPATNPPVITSIQINTNQTVTLNLLGTAGGWYRVQAAAQLPAAGWVDISTNLADTNGVWTVTDDLTNGLPARFYRAVTP